MFQKWNITIHYKKNSTLFSFAWRQNILVYSVTHTELENVFEMHFEFACALRDEIK